MKIEAGKSYRILHPKGDYHKKTKVHIDFILDDPTLAEWKDDPEYPDHMLIVYRVWRKHSRRWMRYIVPYWELAYWNEWDNTVMNQKKKEEA